MRYRPTIPQSGACSCAVSSETVSLDPRAGDAFAALALLDGRELAAELVATVVGQDVEEGDDGVFRIARRVAKDRLISTADPDARHGHKTSHPR